MDEKEEEDIEDRSGRWCPFQDGQICGAQKGNCKLYDSYTDQCVIWLLNSNVYHMIQEQEKTNEKLDKLLDKIDEGFDTHGF